MAFGILSECLSDELAQKLKKHLKMPEIAKDAALNHGPNKKAKMEDFPDTPTPDNRAKKVLIMRVLSLVDFAFF